MKEEARLLRLAQRALQKVWSLLLNLQWVLRTYVPDDGRASARQVGNTIAGAGIIAFALEQGENEWLFWPISAGVVLLYYGITRDRRAK